MKPILASSVCALALLACQDQLPTEPEVPEPAFDINDVHSGGAALNQHFAFRFPMRRLSQRPPAGEAFAGGLQPVMKICRWTGSACDSPESELTMNSGTLITFDVAGHEVTVRRDGVVVLPDLEAYVALWDSRTLRPTGSEVAEGEIYRLRVLVGGTELGFVDAKVWRTLSQLLQITRWNEENPTNTYFPLPRNSILPVPFWIGELALAQAQSLELNDLPPSWISGATGSVTVTVRDAGGNVATGYRGTVTFTSSDPDAILPPNHAFMAADAGVHTFADAVSFKTAGAGTTLRVTDVADPGIFVETVLEVLPAGAASLELSGLSNPFGAGTSSPITVTARDPYGNLATGYTGTIAFTSTDPQATLPAEYTFTASDAGTHAFETPVTLRTAGPVTVRAEDVDDADIFGEVPVTVGAVAAATLQVTGLNNPTVAGTVNSITVTARDPSGNLAADYTGTIAFTSTDPLADLPESYTFTAGDAGTRTFPAAVTLKTAGPVTVTATDEAVGTITGGQPVTVSPAAAATLLLAGVPGQTTAGVAYDLTVTAKDEFGNTATGYVGTVGFTSNDDAAVLPPAYSFQAGDPGVRSFPGGVTFKTAGDRMLQATDAAAPTITGSLPTTVAPAAAAALRFAVQPSDALTGNAIAPPVVVTAYDPFENLASAFTGQVTVGIGTNPGTGALIGTLQVAAVSGAATFHDLSINAAGNGFTLAASAAGLNGAVSEPFDIIAPTPVEVHWTNAAGGNWSVPGNWSTGTVPTAEQTARIDLAGTYTVTLDVNATVNSLRLGATSGIQTLNAPGSRTLTIMSSSTILATGRLTLTNSVLTGPGMVTNSGIVRITNAQIINPFTNQGTLTAELASSISGALTTAPGSVLQVRGSATTVGTLNVSSGFTNEGTIELTSVANVHATLAVNSGTLVNAPDATIDATAGTGSGARTLNAQLDNRGTIQVGVPLTINRGSADHVNSGLINVSGGNLTLTFSGTSPSFTNTGTVTVAATRNWAIGTVAGTVGGASFTQAVGASLNGGGTLALTSINAALFQTGFTLSALTISNTTASFATNVSTAEVALTLSNAVINGPGTLTNAANVELTINSTTINAPLINAGTLETVLASAINGTFTTVAGSVLKVRGSSLTTGTLSVASGFTNEGTIELTGVGNVGATLAVNSGTLVNAPDATIDATPGTGGGTRTLNAQLDNRGTIKVGVPLTLNRGGAQHVNSGLIDVKDGNLTLTHASTSPTFTNNGTITVAAGRTWSIGSLVGTTGTNTVTMAAGSTLNGGGAMTVNSVNVAFQTAFTLSALSLSNATASFATNVTTDALALSIIGTTINGPGTLTNPAGKTLTVTNTTINAPVINAGTLETVLGAAINGGFTTHEGSTLKVRGSGSTSGTLTVATGFTNNGKIELTSVGNVGATLSVASGILVNASGATIEAALGSGGTRTLNAQLDNRGTITIGVPLTISRGAADHLNSGLIDVIGGNVTLNHASTSPSFTNSGTITLADGRTWTIVVLTGTVGGSSFTQTTGGTLDGGGTFDVGGFTSFSNAGTVSVGLARIGNTLTGTGTFAPATAEFFSNATSIPVGATYSYTNVRVLNSTTFAGSASLAGNLTVAGTGNLTIGGYEVTVAGSLATQNTGVLTMLNAAGILSVSGNASFGGGTTNTRLTAGTLRVAGDFAQVGGTAGAFAPTLNHLTVLSGSGAQAVSFANPGTTAALSHFHRLEIQNASAASVTLGSPVFANGQLRTPAGPSVARTVSSAGHTLQVGGLAAVGLVLDRTPLLVVNGEGLTTFDDAVFRNMDPAATQLRLDRSADVVTFNNIQFPTTPESGVYLHLADTDPATPLFTVTMQGTQPSSHGGKVFESAAGQLLGWPAN